MKQLKRILTLVLAMIICLGMVNIAFAAEETQTTNVPKSLKILAIGNSFSQDAEYYLWSLANAAGIEEVIIGNAYRSGCTLQMHWSSVNSGGTEYSYEKYVSPSRVTVKEQSLESILKAEDWDIITLQQGSASSGMPDSYEPYLTNLIDWVNENKTNPNAKLYWHTTWAYQNDHERSSFQNNYNSDQMTMYNAIIAAKNAEALTHSEFVGEIPSGTAIQNLRTSFIGDTITRDGYHQSYVLGRYTVALTWFHVLTGLPIDNITFVPDVADSTDATNFNEVHRKIITEAVKNAVKTPDAVTTSSYDKLRILAIGNSFSVDGMWWLPGIANDYGLQNVVLGIAYNGGCSLSEHMEYITADSAEYTYYKNTNNGGWKTKSAQKLSSMIKDENWDIITMQQASGSSGKPDTYEPYLTELIAWVTANKTNPEAQFYWQTTWAYQSDSTSGNFKAYDYNQTTMYNAILNAKNTMVLPHTEIAGEIPTGTAIQNMRTSYLGDTVTRDGAHLSYVLGRYTAAMTWFRALTGLSVTKSAAEDDTTHTNGIIDTFAPDYDDASDATIFTDLHRAIAKESANNAVLSPNAVTRSVNTEVPESERPVVPEEGPGDAEIDLKNYTLIDWEPEAGTYYNSKLGSTKKTGDSYISSKLFSKADLPIGTIIEVDAGYRYRPEGWITLSTVNSVKPDVVNTERIVVDEAWWGDYTYRGFNLSASNNASLADKFDEAISHFRIYVPKTVEAPNAKIAVSRAYVMEGDLYFTVTNRTEAENTAYLIVTQKSPSKTKLAIEALTLAAGATDEVMVRGVKDAQVNAYVIKSFLTMQILSNIFKM